MIGHKEIKEIITDLHKRERLPHGILLYGQPGIGKFAFAKAFAHFLERGEWQVFGLGADTKEPALTDVLFVEPFEGTIGVDESRRIKIFLSQKPFVSRYRTVVIRDAELLTDEAQNALLKITEEPPHYGIIIFTARDMELLWPTLVSRLHSYYLAPVPESEIAEWLVIEWGVGKKEAGEIAGRSFGKPGLARAYLGDTAFRDRLGLAARFLKTPPASRRDFLKSLLEPEDFNFSEFLDALLVTLASDTTPRVNGKMWHAVVELRRTLDTFSLNPRIQLSNLWTISKN